MRNYEKQIKVVGLTVISLLCIFFFVMMNYATLSNSSAPVADNGVLDLSSWNFEDGLVSLNGEWEYYEDKLLKPEDFAKDKFSLKEFEIIPKFPREFKREGHATYRLTIKLGDQFPRGGYGLKMEHVMTASKLFVDDQLQSQSGLPADNKEKHILGSAPHATYFQTDKNEMTIVIQVSKYNYLDRSFIEEIKFGTQEDISRLEYVLFATDISIIVMLLVISLIHLSIYFIRMKEKTYLYSGLFFLSVLFVYFCINEMSLISLFPFISTEMIYKLVYISVYSGVPLLILFVFEIIPHLFSNRIIRIMCIPFVFYVIAIIVLPYSIYIHLDIVAKVYAMFIVFLVFYRLCWLFLKRKNDHLENFELLLLLGAMFTLLLEGLSFIFYQYFFMNISLIVFVIFMNIFLALRYTNAFNNLENLSERLFIINEMKDEFLVKTSHELKTPLHGIINISSFLLDEKDAGMSTKQKENLSLIHDTSMKLSNLVNDLIDVTRLKNGEFRLQLTKVDLKVSTQIVFDILTFEIQGKQIQLINEIDESTLVIADENRIRQVLYNLIHNAIKHTQAGYITISSTLSDEKIYFYVEDTGIGLPEEKQEEIFGYFEQLNHLSPQNGYQSMGLGLYISRQLIEKMNGEIWVDWSEVGKGTRLGFTLPRAEHLEHKVEGRDFGPLSTGNSTKIITSQHDLDIVRQYKQTILVVDDEPSNIHLLLNILSKYEYNVITAFSGKEALRKLELFEQIDLAILDVMMPEMSGIELCQKIRETHSLLELPLLFATVKDLPEDIELGFKAGANDYITKPFDSQTIIARIQTLLSMKTSMEDAFQNKMAFLQAQIKPHFLYNAISNIIAFCYTDGKKAAHLLNMLSQYLRIIFNTDHKTMVVPLDREMSLIKAYVEIEKARFDRFEFIYHVDEGLEEEHIPSLCIQPVVENAIRHGLFQKDGIGQVTLSIHNHGEFIRVVIEDDGVGISEDVLHQFENGNLKNSGIGMTNIKKRLESIKGANIEVESTLDKGTKVTIDLPKHKMDFE
ncbi:ATP-binding protein [Chengkuizengella sediminis]|uniref:ATP-binding protein n=1 Tax=Chengkuizengella sediminis TaxID=1885917 RepID=UPI0013896B48|nr:ATP-binding protein [Chengkuizengella sediminis]NDI35199.1 response regulator [Chengkuizengella sediminis]